MPKPVPQDSFVTDGKSKTKWSEGRIVERVETTLDANSLVGHIGESLSKEFIFRGDKF